MNDPTMFPLRVRTTGEFRALNEALTRHGYTTEGVCERMGIGTIYHFHAMYDGRTTHTEISDSLDLLVRLFMDSEAVAWDVVRSHFDEDQVQLMLDFGLLASHDEDTCVPTVLLYPTESLFIVSDLDHDPVSREIDLPDDVVYPAITKNTQHFMSTVPIRPCESFLELCSGTGIAALAAAPLAGHAWAVDITDRATLFADFNARLNLLDNVTVAQGDLYAPVEGMTFDVIAAHPPYIPATETRYIYRDGGADGEQITRRIVSEAPRFLRPGGSLYCTCMASDRKGRPLQERLREMLGEHEREFDVLVVEMGSMHPTEHYCRQAIQGRMTFDEVVQRHELFKELEVEELVYTSFVLQRSRSPRPVFTARRKRGPHTTAKDFQWLVDWETANVEGRLPDLWTSTPRASSRARLLVVHHMREQEWQPALFTLGTPSPFVFEAECPAWAGALIGMADGTLSVREHFERLKEMGAIVEDAPEDEFLEFVRTLMSAGLIQIAELPLPFDSVPAEPVGAAAGRMPS